jgi:hypothetical protein
LTFEPALEESLARLAALLHDAQEPGWIIGSVAVALHGGDSGKIRDIDVVLGHRDAERYLRHLALSNRAVTANPLFRSDVFAAWRDTPVTIELMAGLKVKRGGRWEPLSIKSREEKRHGLFVPSRDELRAILISFGRDKDLRRAAALG